MRNRKRKVRVYPYKQGSRSAKTLALKLGGMVLKHQGSRFKPRQGDLVVNWGSSDLPNFGEATVLNRNVSEAGCKLSSFNRMQQEGVNVPNYWTDAADIPQDAYPIVCRTKLRGHSGDGIVIADTVDDLVQAPLYVQYKKKKQEYRIHIVCGDLAFCQRKAKRHDVEEPDWRVRNLEGGFVFCETAPEEIPQAVLDQAIEACEALDLDFGGVDVIWNEHEGEAYVLEVNTACGLEERTAEKYANCIGE